MTYAIDPGKWGGFYHPKVYFVGLSPENAKDERDEGTLR
jgi:hypothetical protein